jgi:hypothetical protein
MPEKKLIEVRTRGIPVLMQGQLEERKLKLHAESRIGKLDRCGKSKFPTDPRIHR